jgi:hypothetical protein
MARIKNEDRLRNERNGETVIRNEKRNVPEEGQGLIQVGDAYREKGATREVIPYFVDIHTAIVQFSDVGRANEDRMRTSDFLNRFEHVGTPSASGEVLTKEETGQNEKASEESLRKRIMEAMTEDRVS